jgi:antitoxin ChpS
MEALTTCLRKVGGSVMLAVPPSYLDLLHLQPGVMVGMTIEGGRLMVDPKPRPRYTLAELLAASDYSQPQPIKEREWIDTQAVSRELI